MGLFSKKQTSETQQKKGFNVYSLVISLAIIVLFVAIAILVLAMRGVFKFNSTLLLVVLTMFIVSGAALLALPWVRRLQNKKHVIVSWVFLGLLIFCAVLWLICTFLLVGNFSKIQEDASALISLINFFKFTLIYTLNFAIASLIATNIIKFGKRMIVFQVILYTSNFLVDIYATLWLCCIKFNTDSFIEFNYDWIRWLINPIVTTIFSIALIYMIVANIIARKIERRRARYARNDDDMPEEVFGGKTQQKSATTQEKLAELKSMLDQNLITQEEYDAKKNDLLSKM